MTYSNCYIGGYEFALGELSRVAHKRFKFTLEEPGLEEGAMMGELEFELDCDVVRLAPDSNGLYRYILITKWNETGEGFPFEQSQRDLALRELAKKTFDLNCDWVAVRNPAIDEWCV